MDRLDMALDDIIMKDKEQKKSNNKKNKPAQQPRKQGGGGGGKARIFNKARGAAQPYVRPKRGDTNQEWAHDLYQGGRGGQKAGFSRNGGGSLIVGGPQTGLRTTHGLQTTNSRTGKKTQSTAPAPQQQAQINIRGVAGPVTVVLSNLDSTTSAEDIKMVVKQCGAVQKVVLLYDGTGRATGTAEVVFLQRDAAVKAVKQFDNVVADGRLLRCYVKPGAGDPVPEPVWAKQPQMKIPTAPRSTRPVYKAAPKTVTSGAMYADRMGPTNGNSRRGHLIY